ncbi:MAG: hypothetical protein LBH05_04995 [Deferribacteraceae bacterium]|jgi:hypothetical protein|nr:hypothetical protein [Deferribacteraceae bacterium]
MNLQKRKCPIEIRVLPRGAGWTDVEWFVSSEMDEPLVFTASYLSNLFGDFILALYYLHPNQFETTRGDSIVEHKLALCDSRTDEIVKLYDVGEPHPIGSYREIPYRAKFHWEEEPGGSTWVLTRNPTEDTSFIVKLNLTVERYSVEDDDYKNTEYSFEFEYHDLCYAVAKAMTDVMKNYGFYGYHYSTSDNGINVHQLVFIKAVALSCTSLIEPKHRTMGKATTDFENEIKLLLFDM